VSVQILTGDCRETLLTLPERSVQACVTSPPYFNLRVYSGGEKEIGLETSIGDYVSNLVSVFAAVKRVLKDDGVLWLNLGDSYAGSGKGAWNASEERKVAVKEVYRPTGDTTRMAAKTMGAGMDRNYGLKQKDLMMIPARVAMALQQDGWYLRAACPWIKRNGMPDSTQDRPTQCVETMFMLTKSRTCYYDSEAVKVAAKCDRMRGPALHPDLVSTNGNDGLSRRKPEPTRLRRTSDWFFESWQGLLLDNDGEPSAFVVNLKGYKEAHFATFPPKLVEPCVLAATSEKGECPQCGKAWERVVEKTAMVIERSYRTHELGRMRSSGTMVEPAKSCTTGWRPQCQCGKDPIPQTILDPFGGSGTTAEVARQHGRNAILCELNPDYVGLANKRLGLDQPQIIDWP